MTPSCERELWLALNSACTYSGPIAIRYPRGTGTGSTIIDEQALLPLGKAQLLRSSNSGAVLLNFGPLLNNCLKAVEKYDLTLVDMRFVKPLDVQLLTQLSTNNQYFFTVEDHAVAAGAGSAVAELLADKALNFCHMGIPDSLIAHATREQQLAFCHLDESGIEKTVKDKLAQWQTPR